MVTRGVFKVQGLNFIPSLRTMLGPICPPPFGPLWGPTGGANIGSAPMVILRVPGLPPPEPISVLNEIVLSNTGPLAIRPGVGKHSHGTNIFF